MEWLILFPLLFGAPLGFSWWQKRRIREGATVDIRFDLSMPSKWAAELTQRALTGEGKRSRIYREQQTWMCSVVRAMPYQKQGVEKARRYFDQLAAARGGQCLRYQVVLGKRSEVHHCEASDSLA